MINRKEIFEVFQRDSSEYSLEYFTKLDYHDEDSYLTLMNEYYIIFGEILKFGRRIFESLKDLDANEFAVQTQKYKELAPLLKSLYYNNYKRQIIVKIIKENLLDTHYMINYKKFEKIMPHLYGRLF